jgi:hypothetical protein
MNLICVTESELSQWVSRKYLDTLATRVFTGMENLTPIVFYGGPYLKQEDARGRIIVNLKDTWRRLNITPDNFTQAEIFSIPVDEIIEIAPSMDGYASKLGTTYRLPIASWSAEKEWNSWLLGQAILEIRRAVIVESGRAGCIEKEVLNDLDLVTQIIRKSLRPDLSTNDPNLIGCWGIIFEKRDAWIQKFRVNGHLEHTSMFLASLLAVSSEFSGKSNPFNFNLPSQDRSWTFQDITVGIIEELERFDLEINLKIPPLFCIAAYLRLYDEIQTSNKDWAAIFSLFRFAKYSVSSHHADIMLVSLLSCLKAEEIYAIGIADI